MTYSAHQHHRRSVRLWGYDYAQPGVYFVTICTYKWADMFGDIINGEMMLNSLGHVVEEEWLRTAQIRPYVELDEYVIMPNHFHGIIMIAGRGAMRRAPTQERFGKPVPGSLPTVVRAFKSAVTKRINHLRDTPGQPVWQRNYFEHVVRNDRILDHVREYIYYNPQRWQLDRYNSATLIGKEQVCL